MAGGSFQNISLCGLSACVPSQVVSNRVNASILGDETIERIIRQTGVEEMRKAQIEQTAGDLGYEAAEYLLNSLNVDRREIGAVIMVTSSPDYVFPATAYVLHKRLRLPEECMSFDISLACSGFVYGVHVGSSLLQCMRQKYLLLIVAEAFKNVDVMQRQHPDNALAVLRGDAGTALLMERRNDCKNEINTALYSCGDDYNMMIQMGMSRGFGLPVKVTEWSDGKDRSIFDPYMDGMSTFAFSTRRAPGAIEKFMVDTNTKSDDYDALVLHQANRMIINRISKVLKWDLAKVPTSIEKYGNTSCASIPLTIVTEYGDLADDTTKRFLTCGFGAGCSWGVASFYLSTNNILPLIESDSYFKEGVVQPF